MKRLAIITTHPIQYQIPLFKKLKKRGIDTHVYFGSKHGLNSKDIDHEFNIKFNWKIKKSLVSNYISFFSKKQKYSIDDFRLSFKNLENYFKKNKYDAILIFGWNKVIYWKAFFLAKKLNIKTILRVETNLKSKISPIKKILKLYILKFIFKFIDKFLYIGILNKSFLIKHGVDKKKLLSSPYCVDNSFFQIKKNNKNKIKKKFGLTKKKVILFVGKLIERKNPIEFLKLAKNFKNEKNLFFVMIGNGNLIEQCKNFVQDNSLKNVSIAGFKNQDEIKDYYSISDLLILTSKYETWGLVINEAMASGLPVIATKQCGASEEIIKKNKLGYVYDCNNYSELLKRFKSFLKKDYKNILNLKKKIKLSISKYNYDVTVESINKILNEK